MRTFSLAAGLNVLFILITTAVAGQPATGTITASGSPDAVRISAGTGVTAVRVQAFADGGALAYDSGWRGGNLYDWPIDDAYGHPLAWGSYRLVVTSRDPNGSESMRSGTLDVQPDRVAIGGNDLKAGDGGAMVQIAHSGEIGQIVTTTGPLSFRFGDFLARKDIEVMRLGADGDLSVAGVIHATKGVQFPDGSIQTTAAHPSVLRLPYRPETSVSGTGTTNTVPKWLDNTGTLGDSVISEVNGKVGIGTVAPGGLLHLFGPAIGDVFAGMGPNIVSGPAMNFGYAGNSFGRGAGFFNVRPDGSATAPNPSLRFETLNQQRMIITNLGNIGINTGFTSVTAPTEKLEVNGNVKFVGGGHGVIFADSSSMTTAGATLSSNSFNGNQSVTGTMTVSGNIVSSGGAIDAGTQFNINGTRALAQSGSSLFIGPDAGAATTSAANTMVGYIAGQVNTAQNGLFVGAFAGAGNTTGAGNTFVGSVAGVNNTTGFLNSYFGQATGLYATGLDNTFLGALAGEGASGTNTGSYDTFVGIGAGSTITSSSFGTFVGNGAGAATTTGSSNTFIGSGAGSSNTTGVFNTTLGASADVNATAVNATAIGANAKATQDNTLILGSIGGFNNAANDAQTGIQTTTPNAALTVGGGITVDSRGFNDGTLLANSALTFGVGPSNSLSGEGIASRRAGGGNNPFGLDFYTFYAKRLSIAQSGDVTIFGNLNVQGNVSKGGGSFKIDHPLDPENKYLYHSFVESPDMKDVYDGVIRLDAKGEANVVLPEWFEALNGDFRYQLTAVGKPSPNLYVADEIADHHFRIAGGTPGAKVSWQVTGIRHDSYAVHHRIPVEEYKPVAERGHVSARGQLESGDSH